MCRRLPCVLLAVVFLLTACSNIPRIGVYKLEVNQGNYVTQEMVERLKPDLSKSQVRLILGTPLVTDAFHSDRWEYVYHHEVNGKRVEQRRFTVFFADDKLARWEGDKAPPAPSYRSSTADAGASLSDASGTEARKERAKADEKGFFGRIWEKLGF